jgi:hypothetical protein
MAVQQVTSFDAALRSALNGPPQVRGGVERTDALLAGSSETIEESRQRAVDCVRRSRQLSPLRFLLWRLCWALAWQLDRLAQRLGP